MKKPTHKKAISFTLFSLLFFAVPAFYFMYWIYCFSSSSDRSLAVENFKNALPHFMRDGGATDFIFVGFAIIALVFAAMGISNKNQFWHKLSLLITVLSALLALLYLFQMM